MKEPTERLKTTAHLKRGIVFFAVLWTAVILALLFWHLREVYDSTLESARIQAVYAFEKDLIFRRWVAAHGGVYVPITAESRPNPYLAQIEDRDVITTSGLHLTLINPAYMTRQVHELGRKEFGHQGHLTSLNPIRPANAADQWEAGALRKLESGAPEVAELVIVDEVEYLRLMRPLLTEQSCLKCHAAQGYKVGDVRGGLSESVPMAPLWAAMYHHMVVTVLGYAVALLVGFGGIAFGSSRLRAYMRSQQQAEVALRKSEELLKETGQMARVGGWEFDIETSTVSWTEETYRIHEVPADYPLALDRALDFYHPDDRITIATAVQSSIDAGEPFDLELRLITANNHPLWVRALCKPLQVAGRTVRLTGTFQDITERRQAEEARTLLLSQLSAKNRELERVVAVVSHDLRSPLVSLKGFSGILDDSLTEILSLLKRGSFSAADAEQLKLAIQESCEAIGYVDKSVTKMDALVAGLMQVAHLSADELVKRELDMNSLIADVFDCFMFQSEKQGATLSAEELPPCLGDEGQINQLFSNLVGNALKYADPARPCVVKVSAVLQNSKVIYCVEDNGVGIAPDFLDKIFEIFCQLDPEAAGDGLGLSIVHKIVERHNGHIWVESEPGRGSRFFISL